METTFDAAKIVNTICRFRAFVCEKDGSVDGKISFTAENSFLGRVENYKSRIALEAKDILNSFEWKESWVGKNGRIKDLAAKLIDHSGNLVNFNQRLRFKDRFDPAQPQYNPLAEQAFFDIYRSKGAEEEKAAFVQAKKVFGGYYDTIAFLWFVKDSARFLPLSPTNFENSLNSIGISYKMAKKCSWGNYSGFIAIVKRIRDIMQNVIPETEMRLIDAHSFLWVINEDRPKDFRQWIPNKDIEAIIEEETEDYLRNTVEGYSVRKNRISSVYTRSAEIAKETKKRANGVCELCGNPAPFMDRKGQPYLEAHHVVWLSRGGKDSTENTVALCPNCHTRMHVLDDSQDVTKLMRLFD